MQPRKIAMAGRAARANFSAMLPLSRSRLLPLALGVACLLGARLSPAGATEARSNILAGPYDGTFDAVVSVNELAGAYPFYNSGFFGQNVIIANVEAGHVWGGHEVFDRTGLSAPASPALLLDAGRDALAAPDLGDVDFHATMVGHVLAGTGLLPNGDLSLLGAGLAPLATLWSGAIATHFDRTEENIGSFEISEESFRLPYEAFFRGTVAGRADVINSSWGFDDPAGISAENRRLDALAAENPTVTFVRSAGNGGAAAAPGVGFNGIVVGALGGADFLTPSEFTSRAPGDFFNPATGQTLVGVRANVTVAAPGETFALAYYGGKSGSLADLVGAGDPATDKYFVFNQSGTSFSSPVVAGGVGLLKNVIKSGFFGLGNEALDTRVLKSLLQAGSRPTVGWNNGQQLVAGVVRTTQALDYAVGAGRLDLNNSANLLLGGTTDVPGAGGGSIRPEGWDAGSLTGGTANDYFFDLAFDGLVQITISLNWFVPATFDAADDPQDAWFADLNLSLWRASGSVFDDLVASSESRYGNSEFLRLTVPAGSYGIRVNHTGWIYNVSATTPSAEAFGLAWTATSLPVSSVPEGDGWFLLAPGLLAFVLIRRWRGVRKRKFAN